MAGRSASTVTVDAAAPDLFGASPSQLIRVVATAVVTLFAGSLAGLATLAYRPTWPVPVGERSAPLAWSNDDLVAIGADHAPDDGAPPVVPTRVVAPSIGVDAPVDQLGLTPEGTMEVPTDFARVGWYRGSAAPGDPGVSVLAGHVDDTHGPAVFYKLGQLKAGQELQVARSDGGVARYAVSAVKVFAKQQFPTEEVFGTAAGPGLRLVTCTGRFDRKHKTYLDNLVVYATPVATVDA